MPDPTASAARRGVPERLFRGYGPLIGFAAIFTAMAVFVPSVRQEVRQEVRTDAASANGASKGAATEVLGESTSSVPADATATSTPGAEVTTTGPGAAATGGTAGTTPATKGATAAAAGTGGAPAISGCGAHQVASDPYSPPCIRFSGSNGGATSKGVTGDTITVAVRIQAFSSGLVDAISKAAGADLPAEDENDIRRTLDGLTEFFNRTYQFYGRKLKLEIYSGRGDVLKEVLGGGQEGAQNDALKVGDEIKAFADVSAITAPYIDALASRKVIAIGAPYLSRDWMAARQPYVWSQFIDCSAIAENSTSYYLSRLAGKPAGNAGGALATQPRKLGIITPNSSWYQDCLRDGLKTLRAGGVEPGLVESYVPDVSSMTTQAATLVPKLQQAGITSVACFCDPLLMSVLTAKASEQHYVPEWINTGVALTDQDIVGQLFAADQWKRSIGASYAGPTQPQGRGVGYQAYKAVRKDEPSIGVDLIYGQLQLLAIGVQMAGPNLTPDTYAQGMFRYPTSTGPLGTWKFGPGDFTTSQDSREIYWDPNRRSVQTGKPGAYVETEPGKRYPIGGYTPSSGLVPGLTP
ncbi:MAG: hypothetical protein U0Q22_07115 [Acidimicrobiales bacterium]